MFTSLFDVLLQQLTGTYSKDDVLLLFKAQQISEEGETKLQFCEAAERRTTQVRYLASQYYLTCLADHVSVPISHKAGGRPSARWACQSLS